MSEHISDLLSPYLDNELSDEDVLKVERHLQACVKCQNELEALDRVKQAVYSAFAYAEPSSGLEERIKTAIQNRNQEKLLERGIIWCISLVAILIIYTFIHFRTFLQAVLHVLLLTIHLGSMIFNMFLILLSANNYITSSVIGIAAAIILIMGLLIIYLVSSTSVETRRRIL